MGRILLRIFLYCLWTAAVALAATEEGYRLGTSSHYSELSSTEYMQSGLLALTALLFWWGSRISVEWRNLCVALAYVGAVAAVREQDSFLDRFVFDGAWQLLAALLMAGLIVHVWRSWQRLQHEVVTFEDSRGAGLLVGGFLAVFVFSRIVGMQTFWRQILGEGYVRVAKNFVEEGLELFGYSLLVIGAVETVLQLRRMARSRTA